MHSHPPEDPGTDRPDFDPFAPVSEGEAPSRETPGSAAAAEPPPLPTPTEASAPTPPTFFDPFDPAGSAPSSVIPVVAVGLPAPPVEAPAPAVVTAELATAAPNPFAHEDATPAVAASFEDVAAEAPGLGSASASEPQLPVADPIDEAPAPRVAAAVARPDPAPDPFAAPEPVIVEAEPAPTAAPEPPAPEPEPVAITPPAPVPIPEPVAAVRQSPRQSSGVAFLAVVTLVVVAGVVLAWLAGLIQLPIEPPVSL